MSKKEEMRTLIKLCDKDFLISVYFSIEDMELYNECFENDKDPKKALAFVIHKKLQENETVLPTQEKMLNEAGCTFEEYALKVINHCEELRIWYDKTDISLPILERFAEANKKCLEDNLENVLKSIQLLQTKIERALMTNPSIDVSTTAIQNMVCLAMSVSSDFVENINIPGYSADRKRQLEKHYQMWGSMGWSVIPYAPIGMSIKTPINQKEVDRIALQYFDEKFMRKLFAEIREKNVEKNDIDSAIFCYENKQYKACVLLLFAIVNAKLIRLQRIETGHRREVGKKAVKFLEDKCRNTIEIEQCLFSILRVVGVVKCLDVFFEDGKDFQKEPPVINRNFVSHGMSKRNVSRKDCIQVFLVLYNLTELLEKV